MKGQIQLSKLQLLEIFNLFDFIDLTCQWNVLMPSLLFGFKLQHLCPYLLDSMFHLQYIEVFLVCLPQNIKISLSLQIIL